MEFWLLGGLALFTVCFSFYVLIQVERIADAVLVQQWVSDTLDENVRYLAATLATWHTQPAKDEREKAERDKDVDDILRKLNSPGPGLMQWADAKSVRARYNK